MDILNHFTNLRVRTKLVLFMLVPLITIFSLISNNIYNKYSLVRDNDQIFQFIMIVAELDELVHSLQKERGLSSGFVASEGKLYQDELSTQRQHSNKRLSQLYTQFNKLDLGKSFDDIEVSFRQQLLQLEQLPEIRKLVNQLDDNGGVLFAPIGPEFVQMYTQILRQNNEYFGKKQLQVKFSRLITKVELDDLELITNFDDFEIIDDPGKVNNILGQVPNRVQIKYTSDIVDDLTSESHFKIESIDKEQQKLVITYLKSMELSIKNLKKEDNIDKCFNYVEDVEIKLEELKKFKKLFQIKIKRMQNILNQVRSYNIIRKELEKKKLSDEKILNKKVEILNKQIEQINNFLEILKEDISKVKTLY